MLISIGYISPCKICGIDFNKIKAGAGKYKSQAIEVHLQQTHKETLNSYINKYFKQLTSICKCGCGLETKISARHKNIQINEWIMGHVTKKSHTGFANACKKLSKERKGKNNPMYGKVAWNYHISRDNKKANKFYQAIDARKNIPLSQKHKLALSNAAKKRKIHGFTGHKHSEKTKNDLRFKTIEMHINKKFPQTMSRPHQMVSDYLNSINISHINEAKHYPFLFDIEITGTTKVIEVQGDFFHSNPKLYPDGPISKIQKRNYYRDIKKREFCKNNQLQLIELWESAILDGTYKGTLCKLLK